MLRALGIGLALVVAWAMFGGIRVEPMRPPKQPIDNSSTRRGQEPWAASERNISGVRKRARASALQALDQAWSVMCSGEGQHKLLSGISYYFEQRGMQERGYPRSWGEPGARFIKQAWGTADDLRIERLTRETYGRGYFRLDDLRPHVSGRVEELVRGERVTGKPCGT